MAYVLVVVCRSPDSASNASSNKLCTGELGTLPADAARGWRGSVIAPRAAYAACAACGVCAALLLPARMVNGDGRRAGADACRVRALSAGRLLARTLVQPPGDRCIRCAYAV